MTDIHSDTTRQKVERYATAHGVKKGHLVEEGSCTTFRPRGNCPQMS
jgi:hypothetical protein